LIDAHTSFVSFFGEDFSDAIHKATADRCDANDFESCEAHDARNHAVVNTDFAECIGVFRDCWDG
jgi:hypothetical protein